MAYGVKYRVEYKNRAGVNKKIDIEERDYTGARTDIVAGEDPLQIELPVVNPYSPEPVITSGCTIAMISATNMMFRILYSIDPQKIRVRIYAGASTVPYFSGYGNTEVLGEDYSRLQDYEIAYYCNDGFATLERYKYLNGTAKYDTIETIWNILVRIITKMGLPFQYLYFASKYSCDGVTPAASETLWHNLMVDQLNYYDEKDEPMTYKQVLEALLMSYGLSIRWVDGSLVICEPSMLASANFSAKRYDSSFAYVDTVNLAFNFDISNGEINWDNEDQALDIKSGFSKQKIRYSPYVYDGAIKAYDLTDRTIWTGTETWTLVSGVYRLSGITAVTGHTLNPYTVLAGHKQDSSSEEDIYFQRSATFDSGLILTLTSGRKIAAKSGQFIMLTGKIYVQTKANEFSESAGVMAKSILVPVRVRVGGKGPAPYDEDTHEHAWAIGNEMEIALNIWTASSSETLCDSWQDFRAFVPWNVPTGVVEFDILNPLVYSDLNQSNRLYSANGLINFRVKDFEAKVYKNANVLPGGLIDLTAKIVEIENADGEYTGTLNEEFINEAPEITLLHSDGINMSDRGSILKLDGTMTAGWRKTGDTVSYRLPDLLLRSIHSQYQDSLNQLTGTIEAGSLMQANGGPGFLFTLQDTDNLGACKLMFTGGTYNDFDGTLNGTFLEIKEENLVINIIPGEGTSGPG